jgi:hypothetical protein
MKAIRHFNLDWNEEFQVIEMPEGSHIFSAVAEGFELKLCAIVVTHTVPLEHRQIFVVQEGREKHDPEFNSLEHIATVSDGLFCSPPNIYHVFERV